MPILDRDRLTFDFPGIDPGASVTIAFQRTLRIPDTGRDYPLPPGLGRFPLRHAEDYPALSARIGARGGVVLPIWQAEALWLDFGPGPEGDREFPVAIKVAAGKINAVTGEAWSAPLHRAPQDYLVWPEQPWLDGFAVAGGIVRQFVAMPLGEGYSVEEQLTGGAEWGGLQISVTPLRREAWERWRHRPVAAACPAMFCESAEMGLGAGGRMRQVVHEDPHDLEDWDMRATQRVFVTLCHAAQWRALTGEAAPTEPPTARAYAEAGLPWFEHYGAGTAALPGGARLAGVASVGKLHMDRHGSALPGSGDVDPGRPVRLGGVPRGPRAVRSAGEW